MKKAMKKWMAMLCVLAIVFSFCPSVFADEEYGSPEPQPTEVSSPDIEVNVVVNTPSAPAQDYTPSAPAQDYIPSAPVQDSVPDVPPASEPGSDYESSSFSGEKDSQPSESMGTGGDALGSETVSEADFGLPGLAVSAKLLSASPDFSDISADAVPEQPAETVDTGKTSTGLLIDRPTQTDSVGTTVGNTEDARNLDFDGMSNADSYNIFFNQETGVYSITYTIQEETDSPELTLDFTKALEALASYAGMSESNTLEPGDSRVFEIYIQSDSQHVYKYQSGSFVLTTPEVKTESGPESEMELLQADGARQSRAEEIPLTFDEQTIENGGLYTALTTRFPAFRQALVDYGIPEYDIDHNLVWRSDLNRFIRSHSTEELEQMVLDYYNQADGKAEGEGYPDIRTLFKESEQAQKDILASSTNTAGNNEILSYSDVVDSVMLYDNMYKNIMYVVYGEEDVKSALGNDAIPTYEHTSVKTVYSIVDYDDMKEYSECYPANELGSYYVNVMKRYGLPEDTLVSVSGGSLIFGFATEDGEIATASNSTSGKPIITSQVEYKNSDWRYHEDNTINSATVGEYMKGEESEVWRKADAYFAQLLADGISKSEATQMTNEMVSFMMAANINFDLAGNNYQDTEWGYHNTIKLRRVDGEVSVTKADENGDAITGDETVFQLWYYEDTDKDNVYTENDDKYYYTSWQKNVTDEITGEIRQETTYSFLKYDPENTSVTYTIDTTNGQLNIDYDMLEGIIYYLQEQIAPEGYELDSKIYIICDTEEKAAQAKEMLRDAGVYVKTDENGNPTEDAFTYAGAVHGGKLLDITVVNASLPTPEINPPTPPVPDFPVNPGNNGNPQNGFLDIDDFMTPLAGAMVMNEGDCIN